MESASTLTAFLGWCTIINIGLLSFSTFILVVFNASVKKLHSRIIKIEPNELNGLYFNFLGNYKIAVIVLNLVPYCALKIMTWQ